MNVAIFTQMPNFAHRSIFDAKCLTLIFSDGDRTYRYMCVSRPQGSIDSGCALGTVIPLHEKLRNILFIEHFECESYVVKISFYH